MIRFVCNTLIKCTALDSKPTSIRCIHTNPFLNSVSSFKERYPLTTSYFANACGLSPEEAVRASEKVSLSSTEKPDSVLQLFKAHGFTKYHITILISRHPRFILADPVKTLKPKIEFFESLGLSGTALANFVCSNQRILLSSLNKRIIPTLDYIKQFVGTNENLVHALKQMSCVVDRNLERLMKPNFATLRAYGVSEDHIRTLFLLRPRALIMREDLFKDLVEEVMRMGFQPRNRSFISAMRSVSFVGKVNWGKKKELLESFGWSEKEFLSAFRVQPMLMLCSERKLTKMMDFFVKMEGLKPSDVAKCPNILLTSLDCRIIPRCSVLKVLRSKGLIKKQLDVVWLLNERRKDFEKKFVAPYVEDAPEVIKAYQGATGFERFSNAL